MSSSSVHLQNGSRSSDRRMEKSSVQLIQSKTSNIKPSCVTTPACAQNGHTHSGQTAHGQTLCGQIDGLDDDEDDLSSAAELKPCNLVPCKDKHVEPNVCSCHSVRTGKTNGDHTVNGLGSKELSTERVNCSAVSTPDSTAVTRRCSESCSELCKAESYVAIGMNGNICRTDVHLNGDGEHALLHQKSDQVDLVSDNKLRTFSDQSACNDFRKLRDSIKSSLKQHSSESLKHRKSVTIEEGSKFISSHVSPADSGFGTCISVVTNGLAATTSTDNRVEAEDVLKLSNESPRRNRTRSEGDSYSIDIVDVPIVRCRSYELKQIRTPGQSDEEDDVDDDSCDTSSSTEDATTTNDEDGEEDEEEKERHKKWIIEAESEKEMCTSPDGRFLKFDKEIGCGSFKTVYKGLDTKSDPAVHIAWCELQDRTWNKSERERFQEEAEMLKTLQHPNIVRFYDFFEIAPTKGKSLVVLVTELMTSGTLKTYIRRFQRVNTKVLKKWCRQILKGLLFLHSRSPPVIHRDLKCDNIFIAGPTGAVKIGDLGLATLKKQSFAKSVIGTPEFMAPEMYDERYNESVDVYAFGMCMMEMSTGQYPYSECHSTAQIFKRVISGVLPEAFDKVTDTEVKDVIGKCLHRNPDDRYTVKELLQLEFFAEDTGIRVDLVRTAVDTFADVIQLQLHVTHARRRGLQQRENEAVQFSYNINSDNPDGVAHEMVKSGYAHDEDASTIARQISSRVLQLKKAREQRRQADASRLANTQSAVVQGTDSPAQTNSIAPLSTTVEHHSVNLSTNNSDNAMAASSVESALQKNIDQQLQVTNELTLQNGETVDSRQPRSVVCVTMTSTAAGTISDSTTTSNSDAEIAAVSVAMPKTSRKSREHRNPSGSGGSGTKLKRRIGAARTSVVGVPAANPPAPKLKFVNVAMENGVEIVECQLETARHQSVSFKFSRFSDRPDDIAANMVEKEFLTNDQVDTFVKEIVDIIELCRDHPRRALAVATEGASVQGSSRSSVLIDDEIDGVFVSGDGTSLESELQHTSSQSLISRHETGVIDGSVILETSASLSSVSQARIAEISDTTVTKRRGVLTSGNSMDAVTQTDEVVQDGTDVLPQSEDAHSSIASFVPSVTSVLTMRRTSLEQSSCATSDAGTHAGNSSSNENSIVKLKPSGAGNLDFEHLKLELDRLTGQSKEKAVIRPLETTEGSATVSPSPSMSLLHSHSSACLSVSSSGQVHLHHMSQAVQMPVVSKQNSTSQHDEVTQSETIQFQASGVCSLNTTTLNSHPHAVTSQQSATSQQHSTEQLEQQQQHVAVLCSASTQQQQHEQIVQQQQQVITHLSVPLQIQQSSIQPSQLVPNQPTPAQQQQSEQHSVAVQQMINQHAVQQQQVIVSQQNQLAPQSVHVQTLQSALGHQQQYMQSQQTALAAQQHSEQQFIQQLQNQHQVLEHSGLVQQAQQLAQLQAGAVQRQQSQLHLEQQSIVAQHQQLQQQVLQTSVTAQSQPVSIQQQLSVVTQQLQQQQLVQQQSIVAQHLLEHQHVQHQSSVVQQLLKNVQQASANSQQQFAQQQSDVFKLQQFGYPQTLSSNQQQTAQQHFVQNQLISVQQHPFLAQQQFPHQETVASQQHAIAMHQQHMLHQQSFTGQQGPAVTQHYSVVGHQQQPHQSQQLENSQSASTLPTHYPMVPQMTPQQPANQQAFIMPTLLSSPQSQMQQTMMQFQQYLYQQQQHPLLLAQQMQAAAMPQSMWQAGSQNLPNMATLAYAAQPQQFSSYMNSAQLLLFHTLIESGIPLPNAHDIVLHSMSNTLPGVYPSAFPAPVQMPVTPVLSYGPPSDLSTPSAVVNPTAPLSSLLSGTGALHNAMGTMPANVQLAYYQLMQLIAQPNPLVTPQILQTMLNQALMPLSNNASVTMGAVPAESLSETLTTNLAVESLEPCQTSTTIPGPVNSCHISLDENNIHEQFVHANSSHQDIGISPNNQDNCNVSVSSNSSAICCETKCIDITSGEGCLTEHVVITSRPAQSSEVLSSVAKKNQYCPLDLKSLEIALRQRLGPGPKQDVTQHICGGAPHVPEKSAAESDQQEHNAVTVQSEVDVHKPVYSSAPVGSMLSASAPENIGKSMFAAVSSSGIMASVVAPVIAQVDVGMAKRRFSVTPVKANDVENDVDGVQNQDKTYQISEQNATNEGLKGCAVGLPSGDNKYLANGCGSNSVVISSNQSVTDVVGVISIKSAQQVIVSSCSSSSLMGNSRSVNSDGYKSTSASVSQQDVTDATIAATVTQLAQRHIGMHTLTQASVEKPGPPYLGSVVVDNSPVAIPNVLQQTVAGEMSTLGAQSNLRKLSDSVAAVPNSRPYDT